ncbi:DnaA N-terminal domain-containing protein [Bradyrhizobium sp. 26S5]|uniref:DnaA N-terminal domain-containing protein n=1 Tax=Bradyrhizobium sp. 26S5 TaxID=3139729 RepID=UPI0030D61CEB
MADQQTAHKLWCLDRILRDQRATHLDFRLAYYIASVTDRATGEARFKQSSAAEALGVTRRAVQLSSERLRVLGHIDISFTPGRKHLNGYRLCMEKANVDSPIDAKKGERRDEKRRTASTEKANRHSHQSSLVSIPCLIPSRAREPSALDGLGPLGAAIRDRIGSDNFRSWFDGASIGDATEEAVTLELPTKFKASMIESRYADEVLACLQAQQSSIERVRFVARRAA